MEQQRRNVHRTLAFLSFLLPFITYYLTAWPSISSGTSGTLAAAAFLQQVPEAPGAPFWIMAAGAFIKLLPGDPARLLLLFSALCGGLAAMTLYLATVTLASFRSVFSPADDEDRDGADPSPSSPPVREVMHWGGLIAALSFAWFDSQWTNASEISVHPAGTLLVAVALWSVLRWYRDYREGEDRSLLWLLAAAWALGLSIGVDRTALALIPGAGLLIWILLFVPDEGDHPRYLFSSLLGMAGILLLWQVLLFDYLFIALAFGIIVALIASLSPPLRRGGLAGAFLLLFLMAGYTSYVQVALRSEARPPLNELEAGIPFGGEPYLLDYLNASIKTTATNEEGRGASSRVTAGQVYTRSLLRNLVGRLSDAPDAPAVLFSVSDHDREKFIAPSGRDEEFPIRFYALPLLLALAGFAFHFRHDWRTALAMTAGFLGLGPLLALHLISSSPSVGEVDGFFSSSLIFPAVWIGLAAIGLAGTLQRSLEGEAAGRGRRENMAMGAIVLCFIIAPLNLVWNGWGLHNRSGNYLPHDFARNILIGCDSNAVLFVENEEMAGRLWFVQDVEEVRRDVRVVRIDRLDRSWYRARLKDESAWNAPPISMSMPGSDELTKSPVAERVDSMQRVVLVARVDSAGRPDTLWWGWRGVETDSGLMRYTVADQAIRDIVQSNIESRPIYMAVTLPSRRWAGLEKFFRWEGLAFRIVPERGLKGIEGFSEFAINYDLMQRLLLSEGEDGFFLRGLNDPDGAFGSGEREMVHYYRRALLVLAADALKNRSDTAGAVALLDRLDRTIPIEIFPMPYWKSAAVAVLYRDAGDREGTERYARHTIERTEGVGGAWRNDPIDRDYNPYQIRARMYGLLGEYEKAIESYRSMSDETGNDPVVRGLIEELRVERRLVKGDTAAAVRELREIIRAYGAPTDAGLQNNLGAWKELLQEMENEAE